MACSNDPPPGNTVFCRELSRLTDIEIGAEIRAAGMPVIESHGVGLQISRACAAGLHADASRSMAGSASRKRSASHAPSSVRGDDELTVDLDHTVGADQPKRPRLLHFDHRLLQP
jgi:hypothetical protein